MAQAAKKRAKAQPPPLPLTLSYVRESRSFATGFLFILPLLVAYEVGIVVLHSEVINWAHGIVRMVLLTFGRAEPVLFAGLVAMLVVVALAKAEHLRIDLELFGLMLAESVVYACVLGAVCSFVTQRMVLLGTWGGGGSAAREVVLSIGAGVYEELLFRVALLGGLYYVLRRVVGAHAGWAMLASVVVSAAVFSACHHVGPYGEPWELGRVVYRFWMGVAFAAVYVYRGLGIVVYTHALYDVFVSLGG